MRYRDTFSHALFENIASMYSFLAGIGEIKYLFISRYYFYEMVNNFI